MRWDEQISLANLSASPVAPEAAVMVADVTDDSGDETAEQPEMNFFERLLDSYEEDPERWDGLE